jgi:hypothetical protein
MAPLLSERNAGFGFIGHGYRPVIVVAITSDAVAIVALSAGSAWRSEAVEASSGGAILPSHGALALTEGATAAARA